MGTVRLKELDGDADDVDLLHGVVSPFEKSKASALLFISLKM